MSRPRLATCLLAVPIGMAGLAGCAVDDTASGGSGQGSGTVVIACTPQEEQCQAMAAAFTKSSGIKATYVRMSSGEGVARLDSAKSKPEFDVLYGGPSDGHVAAAKAGLTEKYVSPEAAKIPDEYKAADGTWTGTYVGALGFCSNKDVLAELGVDAPTSWQDLLDPKLRKNVAIAHPSTSGTSYTAVWTQMVLNGMDEAKTFDYLAKLHQNVLQYSKSGSAPGQMAGRGEVAVGIVFSHDCVKYQKEGFDMLENTFPSEGTGYEVGAVSLVKNGPNAENGKKFIDWTLTPEHQDIGPTVGSFQIPTNPDAKVTEEMVKLDEVNLVDYDAEAAGERKKEITAKFDAEVAPQPKE
ncbi:ABC transporter substrate-binding protein [Phycicoccus sonneratiae]|uniref:ABC transporter substrate-binding protein n=1 Tax=Phycicoccus sonneratiae TaxID=2807628 RepID=A0ABS2CQV1_9MICO|nr:ABC transporter substrate-binding protein [Phycicoccus sonneraticus]MBM6401818.1 ABC transporter substrate-binding protein [Phycicoccus sonneraticus]